MIPFTQIAANLAAIEPEAFWITWVLAVASALAAFAFSFRVLRQARIIEDTPTAKTRSAAQGYCELNGHARLMQGTEVVSPLSRTRCAWWRYKVEEKTTVYRNGKRQTQWRTIDSATSEALFLLCDDTGECIVDPGGADVYPSLKRTWYGSVPRPMSAPAKTRWWHSGNYRYTESLVQVGDFLYALGQFRTSSGTPQANTAGAVKELLNEWKRDRQSLLANFDRNRDGRIDLEEWEAVRRAALEQVQAAHAAQPAHPDVNVFSRPKDGRPYILSTLSQEKLTRRLRLTGLALLVLSLVLGAGCVFALQSWLQAPAEVPQAPRPAEEWE